MATLILGATIGSVQLRKLPLYDVLKVLSIKLIFIPAIVVFLVYQLNIYTMNPVVADLLIIEAAVAPASQLVVQVRKYGGPVQEVGSMMLISYLACLVTIPAWFALWRMLVAI
jgi:predicted permease